MRLTQQNDNAGQDGDERASTEACREHVRLHVARQNGVFAVTGAHSDGQCVGAAQSWEAIVIYLDGEEVDILSEAAEAFPPHGDTGCAICAETEVKPNLSHVIFNSAVSCLGNSHTTFMLNTQTV